MIVGALPQDVAARRPLTSDALRAWRWVGWFSLVLAMAGVGDWVLAWIPFRLGSAEWEFGTVAATFAGFPLVTMGLAGLLASALARSVSWQLRVVGSFALLGGALIFGALIIFLLNVPLALTTVDAGVARIGIIKAIVKTSGLGLLFGVAWIVAGIAALRHSVLRHNR